MAGITMSFDAETAKAVQGFLKIENAEKKLEQRMERLKQKNQNLNKSGKRGSSEWQQQLKSLAGSYLGVQGAIAAVTKGLQMMRQEIERAKQIGASAEMPLAKLAQLSGGDPRQMRRMVTAAKRSAREGGMSVEQAAGLQFSLESMGLAGDRKLFAELYAPSGGDVAPLAEGVATLRDAMGAGETGDTRALLNKLFTASAVSKTGVEQFAPAATIAAQTAGAVGASDEELMATLAYLSRSTKSAEVAGTQISAFSKGLIGTEYEGMGLLEAARAIDARSMSNEELQKFFGRIEGFKGFRGIMGQFSDIEALTGQLGAAQSAPRGRDAVSGIIGASRSVDEIRGAAAQRTARASADIAILENQSSDAARRQAAIDQAWEKSVAEDEWAGHRYVRHGALKVGEFMGFSPESMGYTDPEQLRRQEEHIQRLIAAQERQAELLERSNEALSRNAQTE